jgi:hypothetical protein
MLLDSQILKFFGILRSCKTYFCTFCEFPLLVHPLTKCLTGSDIRPTAPMHIIEAGLDDLRCYWVDVLQLKMYRTKIEDVIKKPYYVLRQECVELYIHSSNTPSWRGAQLKEKQRDNFTLPYLTLPYLTVCSVVQCVFGIITNTTNP